MKVVLSSTVSRMVQQTSGRKIYAELPRSGGHLGDRLHGSLTQSDVIDSSLIEMVTSLKMPPLAIKTNVRIYQLLENHKWSVTARG